MNAARVKAKTIDLIEVDERAAIEGRPYPDAFGFHSTAAIFAPLPETKWIVAGLQLCPGRTHMTAAYGNTGKTLSKLCMAIEMSAGLPIWGHFDIGRPMRTKGFDYEQGTHASFKRAQRIAKGLGIEQGDIGNRLELAIFPSVYLNSPGAEAAYARALENTDYAFIDALKGATPGEDENDSKIRSCIDVLTRVSEKTGCAIELIHHAGKPKEGHADMRTIARGSSAIFDACGSVFVMVGERNKPKLMSHQKTAAEAEGGSIDDFYVEIVDVADETNPKAGVRVKVKDSVEVKPDASRDFDVLVAKVRDCIRHHPDIAGTNAIRERLHLNKSAVVAAVAQLEAQEEIHNLGTKSRPKLRLR